MQLKALIVKTIVRAEKHLCPRYCGVVDRRRVIAYLFATICESIIIPYHFVLFTLLREPWGGSLTLLQTLCLLTLQYLVWTRKVKFVVGISAFYLLLASKLGIDCLFATLFGHSQDTLSILGNMFVLFLLAMTALSQLLHKTCITIVVGLVPLTLFYIYSHPLFYTLLSVKSIFIGFMMVGYVAVFNMSLVSRGLRQPQRVSRMEKKALDMLANLKDKEDGKAGNLIERLNPDLRQNLIENASIHLRQEELDNVVWDHVCDDLTNSEIQICKLILDGKTLKEICVQLGKSESNITSQRCHIRKKLNMDRKDDLKRTLEIRIAALREKVNVS